MKHSYRPPKTYINSGFSYTLQCWIINRVVQDCGHPDTMQCQCYGRIHKGETVLVEE